MNNETELLLKQCRSGTETASATIRRVLGKDLCMPMKRVLCDQLCAHSELADRCEALLGSAACGGVSPMAKLGISVTVALKMTKGDKAERAASHLLTDGCNTGIKQLGEYLNTYTAAAPAARSVAEDLITLEESFMRELRPFL